MTSEREMCQLFDDQFYDWEKNRMYPPNHSGETMKAVNDSHLKAVARAIHFMRAGITAQMTPKLRDSIDTDIERLDQVHKFCRQQIIEPGLPMTPEKVGQGNNSEKNGRTDSKPSD